MSRKTREARYPFFAGAAGPIIASIAVAGVGYSASAEQLSTVLGDVGAFGGVVVGFLATAQAILFAVPDRPVVRRLVGLGGYKNIVRFLSQAIWLWLALTVVSLACNFFLMDLGSVGGFVALLIWTYLFAASLLAFYRAVTLVGMTLQLVARDEGN